MKKNLLILGAGGYGRVVKEIAEAMNTFDKIEFLDDQSDLATGKLNDVEEHSKEFKYAFPAFGDSEFRMQWMEKLEELGFVIPVLIHPSALISPSASVYPGSVVAMGAIINTNVVVEKGCIISIGAMVDHDTFIGFGSHIDCGTIVKSHCVVMANTKVDSGKVISRDDLPSPEDFLKANGF